MPNEEITPEDWQWTLNVAKRWKGRQSRKDYGTMYDDEIESAAMMGLIIAIRKKDKIVITDWRGFLHMEIERRIIHELRRCTKSRMKKDRLPGYTNPFHWPVAVAIDEEQSFDAYDETDYFGEFAKWEERQQLHDGLSEIDPITQNALRQYYWENQYFKDIGKQMGISKDKAFRLVKTGIQQLKEKLEPCSL